MKIKVIQREFSIDGISNKAYRICDCEYCCEGIKQLPNINFHFESTENTDNPIEGEYEEDRDLGIMLQNDITTYDPWEHDDLGYTDSYFYKFNYCPICGEKIEVEIVDNVDVSNEVEDLTREYKVIGDKIKKTDSIKKRTAYYMERHNIDKKINSYYVTDTLFDRKEDM